MNHRTIAIAAACVLTAAWFLGCSSNSGSGADTEAPAVSILQPQHGDTVGVDAVTVVCNASDNVGVTRVDMYVDGATTASASVTASPWQATIPIAALSDGQHTVRATAADAAGNVGSSATVTFVKGVKSADVVRRMVLMEVITSANCTPCGPANEYLRTQTNNAYYDERLAIVKYHAPIPLSTDSLWKASETWARPRMTTILDPIPLAGASAPTGFVDGSNVGNKPQDWVSGIDNDIPLPAEAKIGIERTVTGSDVSLTVTLTGIRTGDFSDLRLYTVITQSNIHYNDGNSELVHYEVMVTMLPDAAGEALSIANGQTVTRTRSFTLKPEWLRDDMTAVVFLQSASTKHVLQAAKLSLQ
jgi:hypothetical protein